MEDVRDHLKVIEEHKAFRGAYFDSTMASEFFDLMCANRRLGSGIGRQVYALNDEYVVKFETATVSFQNAMEWELWKDMRDCEMGRRWLAPCHLISPCGMVLMQKRTTPLPEGKKLPTKVPAFIGDTHTKNFGLLNGKIVAHDYGFGYSTLVSNGQASKMRKAKWHRTHEAFYRSRA